jgi:recombination protein RecA
MQPSPASTLLSLSVPAESPAWGLPVLAGRIVELSGWKASARLTVAFGLVLEAQRKADPVAWITLRESSFFPPDVAEGGVDLDALAVVRVPDAPAGARAADHLVRSGGLGLVVLDVASGRGEARIPAPLLTRLMGLAQKHDTAIVILTEKPPDAPSLNSLVSLRASARRVLGEGDLGEVRVSVVKDKRRGPGGEHVESCRGPAGMR